MTYSTSTKMKNLPESRLQKPKLYNPLWMISTENMLVRCPYRRGQVCTRGQVDQCSSFSPQQMLPSSTLSTPCWRLLPRPQRFPWLSSQFVRHHFTQHVKWPHCLLCINCICANGLNPTQAQENKRLPESLCSSLYTSAKQSNFEQTDRDKKPEKKLVHYLLYELS